VVCWIGKVIQVLGWYGFGLLCFADESLLAQAFQSLLCEIDGFPKMVSILSSNLDGFYKIFKKHHKDQIFNNFG